MIKSFTFFILLMVVFSCDKKLNNHQIAHFNIFGNGDFADSTKVYLKVQESNNISPLDTTYFINNSFQFKGNINKPEVYGIYVDSIKGSIGIFMQNDSITIDVNKNNLSDSYIEGSKLHDQYLDFIKKSNQIIIQTSYLYPLFQKARTENDVDKIVALNKKINSIYKENTAYTLNYAKENPDSYIAAFALHTLLNDDSISKDTIVSIYNDFSFDVKKGDFAIEILLYLENQEEIEGIN